MSPEFDVIQLLGGDLPLQVPDHGAVSLLVWGDVRVKGACRGGPRVRALGHRHGAGRLDIRVGKSGALLVVRLLVTGVMVVNYVVAGLPNAVTDKD